MQATRTRLSTRTIDLDHEQLLVLDDSAGASVQVLFGGLWLTEPNHLQDRFGTAGDWLRLESRGRAVLEAIGPTRLRIDEPQRETLVRRWRGWLRRLPRGSRLAPKSGAVALALVLAVGQAELVGRGMQHRAELARSQTGGQLVARDAAPVEFQPGLACMSTPLPSAPATSLAS